MVVSDASLPSIGDFHISTVIDYKICPDHPVFLHELKVRIDVSESQVIEIEERGQGKRLPFGTTAGGSHGCSHFITVCHDYHGVGIHFAHGNFGVLFCPQVSFQGILIKDVTGLQFVDSVKDEYGIPMRGFVINPRGSMQYIDKRDL